MPLQTVLTTRLRLRYPVIAAPLGRGSTPAFLGTLAREGAFGFVALGHISEIELRQTLSGYIASAGGAVASMTLARSAASCCVGHSFGLHYYSSSEGELFSLAVKTCESYSFDLVVGGSTTASGRRFDGAYSLVRSNRNDCGDL